MARFHIDTQGCRTNIADSMALRSRLLTAGHEPSIGIEDAELIVLNTCSVTDRADVDARQEIYRYRRLNKDAKVIVTGCLAERAGDDVARWEGVDGVLPNRRKTQLLPMLRGPRQDAAGSGHSASDPSAEAEHAQDLDIADGTLWDAPLTYPQFREFGYTRAFVKVQDGCDAKCSFCVIPQTRGASRSLPPERVAEVVSALAATGAREVVLTGIHLGHYGRDLGTNLVALLDRLERSEQPPRIRLTSIEPNEVSEELVERIASSSRFAPHFHLPLQSGSNKILNRMRRPYTAAGYAATVARVVHHMPVVGIGADVIVGFPGESDADFAATCSLIASLPLTYLHVFSYSPRSGTDAATFSDLVSPDVVRARTQTLRQLSASLQHRFAARLEGTIERVLTLRRPNGGGNGSMDYSSMDQRGARHAGADRDGNSHRGAMAAISGSFVKLMVADHVELQENQLIDVCIGHREGHTVHARPLM